MKIRILRSWLLIALFSVTPNGTGVASEIVPKGACDQVSLLRGMLLKSKAPPQFRKELSLLPKKANRGFDNYQEIARATYNELSARLAQVEEGLSIKSGRSKVEVLDQQGETVAELNYFVLDSSTYQGEKELMITNMHVYRLNDNKISRMLLARVLMEQKDVTTIATSLAGNNLPKGSTGGSLYDFYKDTPAYKIRKTFGFHRIVADRTKGLTLVVER